MPQPTRRVLLKLSGEVFSKGGKGSGLHLRTLHTLARRMKEVTDRGMQLVVVTGGGNIWRYRDNVKSGIERTVSDYMGMLATIFNAVALQAALESIGVQTRVLSAIQIPQLAEPYIRRRALRHLEKGRVIICAGGTGNPFFTTDTTAALRASELGCDILLKATNVNGVYDRDPRRFRKAKRYKELTYTEALEKHLNVMDQTAFSLCQDQRLPIRVFDFRRSENLLRAACGDDIGTLVHG